MRDKRQDGGKSDEDRKEFVHLKMEVTCCTNASEGIKFVLCLPVLGANMFWVTGHIFNTTINMSEEVFGFGRWRSVGSMR